MVSITSGTAATPPRYCSSEQLVLVVCSSAATTTSTTVITPTPGNCTYRCCFYCIFYLYFSTRCWTILNATATITTTIATIAVFLLLSTAAPTGPDCECWHYYSDSEQTFPRRKKLLKPTEFIYCTEIDIILLPMRWITRRLTLNPGWLYWRHGRLQIQSDGASYNPSHQHTIEAVAINIRPIGCSEYKHSMTRPRTSLEHAKIWVMDPFGHGEVCEHRSVS